MGAHAQQISNVMALPIIDIGGLRSQDDTSRTKVAEEFRQACTTTGFFYVTNHGLDANTIPDILAEAKRFFALPDSVKTGIGFHNNRGYDGIGRQVLDATVGGDRKESVLYGVELAPDHPFVLAGLPNHVPNPWPPGLPGWREAVQAYYAAMDRLSRTLLNGLALSLDLPWDFFEPHYELPMSSVRLLHYPPHMDADPAREMGAAAHTDWGLITLLAQDETGGLEIQLPSGEWIPGRPAPNAFIVNMGDMMARWTNDFYRSTPHRVMNRSLKDRYSVAFFCDPGYYTKVECIPSCTSATQPPRYAPTTCGAHLAEMYHKSYGAAA
jgi:isopenicillin N synthase-like dioxygenase